MVAALAVVVAAVGAAVPADAQTAEDRRAAERAVREIAAARERADRAAEAVGEAYAALAALEDELVALERNQELAAARLETVRASVRRLAVDQYVRAGSTVGFPLPLDGDLDLAVRREALGRFVTAGATDDLDRYDQVAEDLARTGRELERRRQQQTEAMTSLQARQRDLNARLAELERLERRRQAEVTRRLAAERARRLAEERARAAAARTTGATRSSTDRAAGSGRVFIEDFVCPVAGPRAFSDTWGAPRSGGRRHQGTDMFSPMGTPIVAPVSGYVTFRSVRLGGLSFYLQGDDGNRYFGTHLSGYEGEARRVRQGEVIAYNGDTGNARGTPHLHFEIHPGGGRPVNPYPTLRAHC